MKKIVLGYETIDPVTGAGWNFNGRLEPSSLEMSTEQMKNENRFTMMVYNTIIRPHTNQSDLWNSTLFHSANDSTVVRKNVKDIHDEHYFYPIMMGHLQVYVNYTDKISISNKVRNDLCTDRATLLLVFHLEGYVKYELEKIKALIEALNVPKKNVVLIHADYNTEKYQSMPFLYEPVNPFPYWVKKKYFEIATYTPKYLALCYNRTLRPYRVWFLGKLYREKLIDNINFSLGSPRSNNPNLSLETYVKRHNASHFSNDLRPDEIDFLLRHENVSTDSLDLIANNPAQMIVPTDYETSFVSLITETLVDHDLMFFSEKIYKPIAVGHPFIVLGNPGMLKKLRTFGFKTFHEFWDESYDLEQDLNLRMNKIISILHTLNKKSVIELQDMRHRMQSILIHNQKLLKDNYPDDSLYGDQTEIKDVLLRILETK